MSKIIFTCLLLWLSACTQREHGILITMKGSLPRANIIQKQYPDNKVACKVIETFLNEYIAGQELDSVQVIDKVRDWKIDENVEFTIRGDSWLPATEQERQKKLKLLTEPVENPYPYIYAYAYPITDKLFNKADREYIKAQASKKMQGYSLYRKRKNKIG